ncbi:MAG: polysaccharide biosynthesis/export family protein [Roseomonas sp.]|nr:polysaccharide biosynthesis/export family protein [Roseomonas sp.]
MVVQLPPGQAGSASAAGRARRPPFNRSTRHRFRAAYRLGPEDEVRVTVFNDPRLTGKFRVTDAGMLALPLVGSVAATARIPRRPPGPAAARRCGDGVRAAVLIPTVIFNDCRYVFVPSSGGCRSVDRTFGMTRAGGRVG